MFVMMFTPLVTACLLTEFVFFLIHQVCDVIRIAFSCNVFNLPSYGISVRAGNDSGCDDVNSDVRHDDAGGFLCELGVGWLIGR